LLVADACAGLNSLIALTAVGAVYLYAVKRRSLIVNAAVIFALAPIAIAANVARVAVLVLITLQLGYDAGQSFLHETAGLVMFAAALGGVFFVDWLAALLWERRR
jgi:exosortase/archaeosortase family protein